MRNSRIVGFLLALLGISGWAATAGAQPARLGPEFQVNTYTTSGQVRPIICALPNGDFVALWESGGQDGSFFGVFGQRYDSAGIPLGSEFQVNQYTTGSQEDMDLCCRQDGSFVVVWHSNYQDGDSRAVIARRYDANGVPMADEFQVNTTTLKGQDFPGLGCRDNGDFIVVWEGFVQGYRDRIFGQRFRADATPVGTEFQVNTYTNHSARTPDVVAADDGSFVVVWVTYYHDDDDAGIFGRRFDADGQPLTPEFPVNTYTTGTQWRPEVAQDLEGNFVVVWDSTLYPFGYGSQDGMDTGVFSQRFDRFANRVGTEFQVNTYTTDSEADPSVAAFDDGGFVIVWTEVPRSYTVGQDGSESGIFGQLFDADGSPLGSEFQVNTYTTDDQNPPAVAAQRGRDFAVVWSSQFQDGSTSFGIFGQRLRAGVFATCGDATDDGTITATDALLALTTAVGAGACLRSTCDVDGSGEITATDALQILRLAVGNPVAFSCGCQDECLDDTDCPGVGVCTLVGCDGTCVAPSTTTTTRSSTTTLSTTTTFFTTTTLLP